MNKLEGFRALKSELDTDLAPILDSLQALKVKIQSNCHSDDNPDGLLTREE